METFDLVSARNLNAASDGANQSEDSRPLNMQRPNSVANTERPGTSNGNSHDLHSQLERHIPSSPDSMGEDSSTEYIFDSGEDEDSWIFLEDSSEEYLSDSPRPRSNPGDINYLEFRLPKSQGNYAYGERVMNEGHEIVFVLKKLQQQLQDKPADDVRVQGSSQLEIRLHSHQQYALAWMLWRESCEPAGGIVADETGLGKTTTTIALIVKSLEAGTPRSDPCLNRGGTLIICPANKIAHWKRELGSKGNITNICVFNPIQHSDISQLMEYHVVIASYGTLSNDHIYTGYLSRIDWSRVILDEASTLRNANARKSTCVGALKALKRWALTSAPLQNNLKDIFPILRFLHVYPFDDSRQFKKWIDNGDAAGLARLHCIMSVVMLKRTKNQLIDAGSMPELRPMSHRTIDVILGPEERLVYNKILYYTKVVCGHFLHEKTEEVRHRALGPDYRRNDSFWSQLPTAERSIIERKGPVAPHNILTLMLRLRQICCHPALVGEMLGKDELDDLPEHMGDQEAERGNSDVLTKENPVFRDTFKSSKMTSIINLVQELVKNGDKVVIVSDWVKYLNLIGQQLDHIPGATFDLYCGAAPRDERIRITQRFAQPDGPTVLLVSIRAAARGLDLKTANHVIIADVHWNPQVEASAQNFVYRLGQAKQVIVHKFICKETIEENIVALQRKKLMVAGVVLAGNSLGGGTLEHREMGQLLNL